MIRLDSLCKAYADKVLLDNVSYHFPEKERIALVGPNGQGKTTLLNIICGFDSADSGKIIKPKDLRLGFLPQSFSENPKDTIIEECLSGHVEIWSIRCEMDQILKKMENNFCEKDYERYEQILDIYNKFDGYSLEGVAIKILEGLGFGEELVFEDPRALSGGWRMRLELAKTLTSNPNFLILDEPTNHLDLPAIEWLEEFLFGYKGTVVFVTHDKAILDRLPTITLMIERGKITPYSGTYEMAIDQMQQDKLTKTATIKKLQAKKIAMQRFVDRFGAKATKAAQASSRKKAIDKIDNELQGMDEEKKTSKLSIPNLEYPKSGKVVLTIENLSIGYDKILKDNLNEKILREEKISIIGKNGLGKSTLLKTIASNIKPLNGKFSLGENVQIGFFKQDAAEELKTSKTIWQSYKDAVSDISDQQARGMLGAFLFKGMDCEKVTSVLSGGERSRLALCILLSKRPNLLLLDEPTNHLDLQSKNVLSLAIKAYPGSVIMVSHDRDFIEQTCNRLWNL